jgi:hypothetical protein
MRLGPFLLTRRSATRAVAGLVATLLLSGNVLAAVGLCVVKSPDHAAVMQMAEQAVCPDHVPDAPDPGSSGRLCPGEDPIPQTRSVDLPGPQLLAASAPFLSYPGQSVSALEPPVVAERPVPPPPLYARLQRLRL